MDTEKTDKPSRNFLTKLYAKLKELVGDKVSEEDFNAAVTHARAHAGGKAKAEKRKMGEQSLTDVIERVNAALSAQFRQPLTGYSIFYYAKEVYADRCIACSSVDGKLFEIPFTITGDGDVTFGEAVEVEESYTPVGMNELSSLCAKGHGSRLFMEYAFAEPPDWIPYLPKPGEFKHPVYGEIVITKERNEGFVETFKAGVYQKTLPVDAEHESKLSGAVGWITDMRVNDDGSADAKVEWTPRGVKMIEDDSFKYVSPEWYDVWTEPASGETHADVAIGAALTTRPFFKESFLRPLIANETGLLASDESRTDFSTHTYHYTALAPVTTKESKTMADKPEEKGGAAPAKEEAPTAQNFAEMQSSLQAAEARAAAAEAESRQMGERVEKLEKEGRTRRFNDLITGGGWVGKLDLHLKMMERLGEGSDDFKEYVAEQNALAEQAKTAGLFSEIGSNLEGEIQGALAELDGKAKALQAAEPSLSYAQAYDRAMTENPDLVRRQREEAKGAK